MLYHGRACKRGYVGDGSLGGRRKSEHNTPFQQFKEPDGFPHFEQGSAYDLVDTDSTGTLTITLHSSSCELVMD